MKGFRFNFTCEGFATFRKPVNTAYLDTYPVPPITTVTGLISNSMGLGRGDLRLQDYLKIGIRNYEITMTEEYCQLLKEPKSYFPEFMYEREQYDDYLQDSFLSENDLKDNESDWRDKVNKKIENDGYKARSRIIEYSTSPMKRMVLIDPYYTVYVAAENEVVIDSVKKSLFDLARPLYMGSSDSIADIADISKTFNVIRTSSDRVNTICKGIHESGRIIKIPLRFEQISKKVNLVFTDVLTMFDRYPAKLNEVSDDLYMFGDDVVYLM